MKASKARNNKISLWEKISFGSGDIASCVTFNFTSSYLSYYYTGIAIDRIDSKNGRTKPILMVTTLPLAIMFFLIFIVPDISIKGKVIFAFITCLSFCILYAINNTAYCTMISLLSDDANERKSLGNYKTLGGGIGSLVASFCTLPLIALFGIEGRFQFAPPAILYAVAALVILMNCAVVCKERVGVEQEKIKFKDSIKCAVQSHSWIILCIISFLSFMANALRGQSCIYYAKYCLGMENWATIILTLMTVAQIITAPFTAKILIKLGNQKNLYCGFIIYIVASVFMALSGKKLILLVIFTIISGIGSTLAGATAFTICSDTIDEVENLTGKRPQGIMTSIMMCAMKLGIAGAGILSSIVLSKGGYIADQIQTESAINAIHWNMYWFPIIIYILGLGLIRFFRCK